MLLIRTFRPADQGCRGRSFRLLFAVIVGISWLTASPGVENRAGSGNGPRRAAEILRLSAFSAGLAVGSQRGPGREVLAEALHCFQILKPGSWQDPGSRGPANETEGMRGETLERAADRFVGQPVTSELNLNWKNSVVVVGLDEKQLRRPMDSRWCDDVHRTSGPFLPGTAASDPDEAAIVSRVFTGLPR